MRPLSGIKLVSQLRHMFIQKQYPIVDFYLNKDHFIKEHFYHVFIRVRYIQWSGFVYSHKILFNQKWQLIVLQYYL